MYVGITKRVVLVAPAAPIIGYSCGVVNSTGRILQYALPALTGRSAQASTGVAHTAIRPRCIVDDPSVGG